MCDGAQGCLICQVRTLLPPLGPQRGVDKNEGTGRQHLRVWPHGWVVMGPENTDKADNTYGRGGASQVKRKPLPDGLLFLLGWPLPLPSPAPFGMTRPSGSVMSWVQQREMTVTGGCKRRLSLMHMVRKGSRARSSLRHTPGSYPGSKPETHPHQLRQVLSLCNKINSRWVKYLQTRMYIKYLQLFVCQSYVHRVV